MTSKSKTEMTENELDARHADKMAKKKAARDKIVATKTIEKGLLIVHTGKGKGKSTAAMGLAIRAIGNGMKVGIVQFVKGVWETGERVVLDKFPKLCVIKAMGAIDQSPEILGGLVGAALVGTFLGIFLNYAVVAPIAQKVKIVRDKKNRLYVIVKQTLLAYMNGSLPQVALEFGRKTISAYDRPSIDAVEQSTLHAADAARNAA